MDYAVIFDMDGVIVVSNPYHKKAWKQFLQKHEIGLSEEKLRRHVYGKTNLDILTYFFGKIDPEEISKYANEKEKIYRKLIENKIKTPDNLIEFLELLNKNKITCALATSAPPENVDFILDKLKIRKYFKAVLDETHVSKGKPSPEIYLKTAELIGFSPRKCIVIEDSLSGIKSGLSAGMKVVGITTSHSKKELSDATLVIDDFSELNLERLTNLIKR